MPWKVVQRGEQHCVVKKDTGEVVKCHPTRDKAIAHQRALYSSYEGEKLALETEATRGHSLKTHQEKDTI